MPLMPPTTGVQSRESTLCDRAATPDKLTDQLCQEAWAPNTRSAYRQRLTALETWLADRPLDDTTLANFLAHEHGRGCAPATIALSVAAIQAAARETGMDSPVGPQTRRTLAGIRRAGRGRGRGQVTGLTWGQVDAAAQMAAQQGPAGLRNAALLCVMSDALLRVSELCGVHWSHITSMADHSGRLELKSSKTDQQGRGAVCYLGEPTMKRLQAWSAVSGNEGAVFRRMRRGGHITNHALTPQAVRTILKGLAASVGVTDRVSGHSPRVGSAQNLVERGASLPEVQLAGRWQSSRMVAHYARTQRAGRGAVARLRYG